MTQAKRNPYYVIFARGCIAGGQPVSPPADVPV